MATQMGVQSSTHEQTLVGIVRTLPVERVLQVLDFARYVQTQAIQDFGLADEPEDEVLADEAQWDAQFAATEARGGFAKMAEKVRADIGAGRTRPMAFTYERMLRGLIG